MDCLPGLSMTVTIWTYIVIVHMPRVYLECSLEVARLGRYEPQLIRSELLAR